jgi:predicted alpha/beta hydrolase family esterase
VIEEVHRMASLEEVRKPSASWIADLVFVHGLNGGARTTWDTDGNPSWFAWLPADLPTFAIWSLAYNAPWSKWQAAHAMPLVDTAINALAAMRGHGLGERPICFVAHSLGGLLVKQMLLSIDAFASEYAHILTSTRGVVFLATPHTGADPATWAQYLKWVVRPSTATTDSEAHSPHLRFLNLWYRNRVDRFGIQTQVFFEADPVKGVLVVSPSFADPGLHGVTPIRIDADHFGVAKPTSRTSTVYANTVLFARDVLTPAALTAHTQPGPRPQRDDYLRNILGRVGPDWQSAFTRASTSASVIALPLKNWNVADNTEVDLPQEIEYLHRPDSGIMELLSETLQDQADVLSEYPDLVGPVGTAAESHLALCSLVAALQQLVWPLTTWFYIQSRLSGTGVEQEVGKLTSEDDRRQLRALLERYPEAPTVGHLRQHGAYIADVRQLRHAALAAAESLQINAHAAIHALQKYALRFGLEMPL